MGTHRVVAADNEVARRTAEQAFEKTRAEVIVGVDKREPLAPRLVQPRVARRRDTTVLLVDDADTAILAGKSVGQFRCAVAATVVDEQHLKAGVSLRQDAAHAALQDIRGVVGRDDDGNEALGFFGHIFCHTMRSIIWAR